MSKTRKCPATPIAGHTTNAEDNNNHPPVKSNANTQETQPKGLAAQRSRLLAWVRTKPLTTLQAREHLDIMHPAGRVEELRKAGHKIETVWTNAINAQGNFHRIACYILTGEVKR